MEYGTDIHINASKETVWKVISDIDSAKDRISAINSLEVLERPDSGLVGLKWKESRTMFGKESTETMWVTEAEQNKYYKTRAESHGMIYISTLSIEEEDGDGVRLHMGFSGEAQSRGGKIMNAVFAKMMKKSMNKALHKDLEDIKIAAEASD